MVTVLIRYFPATLNISHSHEPLYGWSSQIKNNLCQNETTDSFKQKNIILKNVSHILRQYRVRKKNCLKPVAKKNTKITTWGRFQIAAHAAAWLVPRRGFSQLLSPSESSHSCTTASWRPGPEQTRPAGAAPGYQGSHSPFRGRNSPQPIYPAQCQTARRSDRRKRAGSPAGRTWKWPLCCKSLLLTYFQWFLCLAQLHVSGRNPRSFERQTKVRGESEFSSQQV